MASKKLIILVVLLLVVTGCQANPKKVELKKPKKEAAKKVKANPLPAKFPKEVPLYPKGQIVTKASSKTNWQLAMALPQSGDQIFGWYFDELTAKNWQVTMSFYDVAKNYGGLKAALGPLTLQLDIRPAYKSNRLAGTEATLTVAKAE